MDSWQPDAGLSPRHAEARRKGQIEQEVRLQSANQEGRRLEPEAPDGAAGHRRAADAIHQGDASRPSTAEAPFLKSLLPALLILALWELRKISLRGLLSPRNLPKGLS